MVCCNESALMANCFRALPGSPRVRGVRRLAPAAAIVAWLFVGLAAPRAHGQTALFTIVQMSDSQPNDSADQLLFEEVLDTVVAGGQPGALLPRPIDLVIFCGDLVANNTEPEWITWMQTIDSRLTANGIPYICVPGNHDVENGGVGFYEQYVGDSGVWDFGSAAFIGHNGIVGATNWDGLRFIGFNNSNGGWNKISAGDLAQINARVAAAGFVAENVFLVCHHPHNGQGVIPLQATLQDPDIVGYMRGHSGSPHATHGLSGIVNPNIWDLNTNAIYQDGALIYYEVFTSQVKAHVIELEDNPTQLPAPAVIPLVHTLTPAVEAPVADFTGAPLSGPAPLTVSFTDLSTGSPTEWSWDFGDGNGSDLESPLHTYGDPGAYSVTLSVTNAGGSDSITATDFISVEPPPNVTLAPVADARVRSSAPAANYGDEDLLRCRDGGVSDTSYNSYLKFEVPQFGGMGVIAATLRLFVTDGSDDGGTLYEVDDGWTELGITWANAPLIGGTLLGSAGEVATDTWSEFDLTGIVAGAGIYSFGVTSDSSNSVYFWSREGTLPPELVLEMGPLCGNGVADPGEDCTTCPRDVQCGPGEECIGGVCEPLCGNSVVDAGEDCDTCPADVPCAPGEGCVNGACERLCGNSVVDPGENCETCPSDVPCPPDASCAGGKCVPVGPSCPWDLDGNTDVNITDLLQLLADWGTDAAGPPDFDGSGDVGVSDLLDLLAMWGPCPVG